MVTKIKKWGNSQGVRLPLNMLRAVDMEHDSEVNISTDGDRIVITKAQPQKRRKNIIELFEEYKETYNPIDIDWGESVGKEIW